MKIFKINFLCFVFVFYAIVVVAPTSAKVPISSMPQLIDSNHAQSKLVQKVSNAKKLDALLTSSKGFVLEGELKESGSKYQMHVIFEKNLIKVSYPSFRCSGTWTVHKRNSKRIIFNEKLKGGSCITRGVITLRAGKNGGYDMEWRRSEGSRIQAKGTLMKTELKEASSTQQASSISQGKNKDLDALLAWTKGFVLEGELKENSKKYKMQAIFDKNVIKVSYPSLRCSGTWTVHKRNNERIHFNEQLKGGSCIKYGLVTLRAGKNGGYDFEWRKSEDSRIQVKGTLTKTELAEETLELEKVRKVYGGKWHGLAFCGQYKGNVDLDINRTGTSFGFIRGSGKIKITKLDMPNEKTIIINDKKGYLSKNENGIDFLVFENAFRCNKLIFVRLDLNDKTKIWPSYADNLPYFCEALNRRWSNVADDARDQAFAIKNKYQKLMTHYDPKRSSQAATLVPAALEKIFGKATAASVDGLQTLHDVMSICAVLDGSEYSMPVPTLIKESIETAKRAVFSEELKAIKHLKPAPILDIAIKRLKGEASITDVMGPWKEQLSGPEGAKQAKAIIQSNSKALSNFPPDEVAKEVDAALKVIFESGTGASLPVLEGEKAIAVRADYLAGREIVGSTFGHIISVDQQLAASSQCPDLIPVRVDVASRLPIALLDNNGYARSTFFKVFDPVEWMCNLFSNDSPVTLDVSYHYRGIKQASVEITKHDRKFSASNARGMESAAMFPQDHPDHAYDKAFAEMFIGAAEAGVPQLDRFTLADLEGLAQRGDLQAATFLALDDVINAEPEKLVSELWLTVIYGASIDENKMRKVSDAGGAFASHLLALSIAKRTDLKNNSFDSLSSKDRHDFLGAYAKARVSRIYWHRQFDAVIKRWNIPVEQAIAAVESEGLTVPLETLSLNAEQSQELSNGDAELALNRYFLGQCNASNVFFNGVQPLAAFVSTYEVRGNVCMEQQKLTGLYNRSIFYDVAQVKIGSCEGGQDGGVCNFTFIIGCSFESFGTSGSMASDKLVIGALCSAVSVPRTATALFSRNSGRWEIEGNVKF